MLKSLIITMLFVPMVIISQNLKLTKISKTDSLTYIDYESDAQWINKLKSNSYFLDEKEKKLARVKVKDNFQYANSISNVVIDYNEIIDNYITKYTSYSWMPRIFGLLNYYEPLFEAKLKEYGLPTDLKYLAIVESNLNPVAGSWAGASGLWQFMPATGNTYSLAKSNYINLFYDPYMSTDAACKYLKRLYKMFGDWNLVLSAYNSGEGRVLNAIRKAGSKNYWVVRNYLPAETKAYAPSYHAVRFIGKMYGLYYSSLPKLKYTFTNVKEITVTKNTTFREFSEKNNINIEILYFLNPHIVTEFIPKNTFVYYLK